MTEYPEDEQRDQEQEAPGGKEPGAEVLVEPAVESVAEAEQPAPAIQRDELAEVHAAAEEAEPRAARQEEEAGERINGRSLETFLARDPRVRKAGLKTAPERQQFSER